MYQGLPRLTLCSPDIRAAVQGNNLFHPGELSVSSATVVNAPHDVEDIHRLRGS